MWVFLSARLRRWLLMAIARFTSPLHSVTVARPQRGGLGVLNVPNPLPPVLVKISPPVPGFRASRALACDRWLFVACLPYDAWGRSRCDDVSAPGS
jgi:hypothetical protein